MIGIEWKSCFDVLPSVLGLTTFGMYIGATQSIQEIQKRTTFITVISNWYFGICDSDYDRDVSVWSYIRTIDVILLIEHDWWKDVPSSRIYELKSDKNHNHIDFFCSIDYVFWCKTTVGFILPR